MAYGDSQTDGKIIFGKGEATIELAGTVVVGDALGYSDGWKRALATAGSVIQLRCAAGEDGVSGQKITAYFDVCLMEGRITGATDGGALYVAEGTDSGQYIQTAPSTSSDANTIVGYMLTATLAAITPNNNADSTV